MQSLLGYNARRASLAIIEQFHVDMANFDLRPVDFSVLSLIRHNPGTTSRQLCQALNILPPNMVVFLKNFEKRQLVERTPHPTDGRAMGLTLTESGEALIQAAEKTAMDSGLKATSALTESERQTLARLLQKIYL
ncbi:MAG: MarR family winged helix-turn-helix transcriptional regulator [Limnohabitans sp.]